MLSSWVLIITTLVYFGLLFGIARWADRHFRSRPSPRVRRIIYGLALAVYCTSWSFYGTAGQASANGWLFPPTYIGVMAALFILGRPIEKMISISERQNIASIADFIASRYGKSQGLGAAVAILTLAVAVPYIALQLKAISASLDIASGGLVSLVDTSFLVTVIMGIFAIVFAAQRVETAGHNDGLMLAIAFDSLIKIIIFTVVGITAVLIIKDVPLSLPTGEGGRERRWYGRLFLLCRFGGHYFCHTAAPVSHTGGGISSQQRLSGHAAVVCLVLADYGGAGLAHHAVGAFGGSGIRRGLFCSFCAPGRRSLGNGAGRLCGGGLAASTGMILVSTVALAVMISNNVVTPLLLRTRAIQTGGKGDVTRLLRIVRRASIAIVLALALGYHRLVDGFDGLADSGLLAMTLAAQFAPAAFIGLYWKKGNSRGALAGMITGALIWAITLLLPSLARTGILDAGLLSDGLFGLSWLRPEALFGVSFSHSVTHGLLWSLGLNMAVYVWVSMTTKERGIDRIQAETFVSSDALSSPERSFRRATRLGDLRQLVERFVGEAAARDAFAGYYSSRSKVPDDREPADAGVIAMTERLLSGALGVASARVVMNAVLRGMSMDMGDAVSIIDEAADVFRFNRDLLQASMNTVPIGVSVVDSNLHLVAWNKAYEEMFAYPKGYLYEGRPVTELIRYNSERGECGEGAPEEHVRKRVKFMSEGSAYVIQRPRPDGRVIEITGRPMSGGGFVTSYADITELKKVERALRVANETLEARVEERTRELAEAKTRAEQIERAKTRFFAAISHDVLQPLNAAKLFTASLETRVQDEEGAQIVSYLGKSLENVGGLLENVLDLSKIEAGGETITLAPVSLDGVFRSLAIEFEEMATQKGLSLRYVSSSLTVYTDSRDLRRIIQNLISNAIKYTRTGRVLFGARRVGGSVSIEVRDTGIGISKDNLNKVFREFQRISPHSDIEGLGLGLAIAERLARRLEHPIDVQSEPGSGSTFRLTLPRYNGDGEPVHSISARKSDADIAGVQILCVDNDKAVRDAMCALLGDWGGLVRCVSNQQEALAQQGNGFVPDLMIVDYHLDDGPNGLSLARELRAQWGEHLPGILITADDSVEVLGAARANRIRVLRKPVRAAALRALIAGLAGQKPS
ncbi:MAG: PAS-domain containing protein [Robiginitomaculum sp.]|nr:PAS-domain containing protein [Robiginitomaculum sp.]